MKKLVLSLLFISCLLLTGCEKKEDSITSEISQKEVFKQETASEESITEEQEDVLTEEVIKENNMIKDDIVMTNEDEVITYFEEIEQEVEDTTSQQTLSKSASQKLKNTFITIADFLFYDGKIGNITFQELSEETKQKILVIAQSIDTNIEKRLPGYKDTIQTTTGRMYTTVSEKIKTGIHSFQEYLKSHMEEDTYQSLQEGASDMKDSFSNAGEKIVEVGKAVKDTVKNWYENFRK